MTAASISLRGLNRASLARQLLLERSALPVDDAVHRVGGLQAQYSPSPYVALWSRVADFERERLTEALAARSVVKATLLRGTLYIQRASDVPALMLLASESRTESWRAEAARRGYNETSVAARHETLLRSVDRESRTQEELKARADELLPPDAAQRYPSWRVLSARGGLVHVPPSGTWGYHGTGTYRSARSWLPDWHVPSRESAAADAVRLFLAAFGPASTEDFQKFSGERSLPRIRAAFGAAGDLIPFRDPAGRTLFDLPDGLRPEDDTPAPVRFLPKFESLVVAYAARERLLPAAVAPEILQVRSANILASFLVDGFAAGTWRIERERDRAVVAVRVLRPISPTDRVEVEGEALRLAVWHEPAAAAYGVTFSDG